MDGFGSLLYPSAPKLPVRTFLIGLPPGAVCDSVTMIGSTPVEYTEKCRIIPAPSIIYGSEEESSSLEEDESIYGSMNVYPDYPYRYLGMGEIRQYDVARIGYCPVAYYPASDRAVIYRSISLRILYHIENTVSNEMLSDCTMDDVASRSIINYSSIAPFYGKQISEGPPRYGYMIITPESLLKPMNAFIDWKENLGYTVYPVTVEWIEEHSNGRDVQEQIRSFLQNNYITLGLRYVLLVGDHRTIPMRYCYPDPSDHSNKGAVPTDYYYADLSGRWDSDNDGFFGECGDDAIDYHPEVIVGRIPMDEADMVDHFSSKTKHFENDTGAWKYKVLLLAAMLNYENEDLREIERTDKATLMERCDAVFSEHGYYCTKMYEKEGLAASVYDCDYPLERANVLNEEYGWPAGYGIVNWGGHGGATGASRWVWQHDKNGIPESYEISLKRFISNTDSIYLDDTHPSLVFSGSCLTAYPEKEDNLGSTLLKHGAVAFIGATREVWYTLGWQNEGDGANASINYWFFYNLIKEKQSVGDALFASQAFVCDHYWTHGWKQWRSLYAFCLYGDPSLQM
jgi:hypothetical protein